MKKEPKVVAVIQARLTSSRLPRKVLLTLGGKTVLEQVIDRIRLAKMVDEIVVAIPDNPWNRKLEEFVSRLKNVTLYKHPGSEAEVLQRTICAAERSLADIIVDVTSDCPCVDPVLIDEMVARLKADSEIGYVSNVIERSYPDGFDVQVYYTSMLKEINQFIILEDDRTHSGWNIAKYYYRFIKGEKSPLVLQSVIAPVKYIYPDMRVTLDTKEDYILLTKVFDHFDGSHFGYKTAIDFIIDNDLYNPEADKCT